MIVEELDHDASIAPFKSESVTKSSENGVKCKSRYRETGASDNCLKLKSSGTQRHFRLAHQTTFSSELRLAPQTLSESSVKATVYPVSLL